MKPYKKGDILTPVYVEQLRQQCCQMQNQAYNRICSQRVAADDHDNKDEHRQVDRLSEQYARSYYLIREAANLLEALDKAIEVIRANLDCADTHADIDGPCPNCEMLDEWDNLVTTAATARTLTGD